MSRESATLRPDLPTAIVSLLMATVIAFWIQELLDYLPDSTKNKPISIDLLLGLAAGSLFFVDIICVIWWYAMYIYKIETDASLFNYFLDVGVCVSFASASATWAVPDNIKSFQDTFLYAAIAGSSFLGARFFRLYYSHETSNTDRKILRRARNGLILALSICGLVFLIAVADPIKAYFPKVLRDFFASEKGDHHLTLVIILSLIGIWLTIRSKEEFSSSADIRRAKRTQPMQTTMAQGYPSRLDDEQRSTITRKIDEGIERFEKIFYSSEKYDRLLSKVHPEDDLKFQSIVLAISSWMPQNGSIKFEEIERKAFMVGLSHWLDDIVDGRGGVDVMRYYIRESRGESKYNYGLNLEDCKIIFEGIYKRLIVGHTDIAFYHKLIEQIEEAAILPENKKYLYFSLNRIAAGSVMYGPNIDAGIRSKILDQHNLQLVNLIHKEADSNRSWYTAVENQLNDIRSNRAVGNHVLGMTTKTVQEMAMASEGSKLIFAYSVLYSLLYSPLLYFHNAKREIENDELVALESSAVNFEMITLWLCGIRGLLTRPDAPFDPRKESRLEQLRIAYTCFLPGLPPEAANAFKAVYDPDE